MILRGGGGGHSSARNINVREHRNGDGSVTVPALLGSWRKGPLAFPCPDPWDAVVCLHGTRSINWFGPLTRLMLIEHLGSWREWSY